jgi:hypothetical protein
MRYKITPNRRGIRHPKNKSNERVSSVENTRCENEVKMNDMQRLEHAESWIEQHIDELRKQYPGEWIRVMDEAVLDHDKNYTGLSRRITDDNAFAYLHYVYPESSAKLWDFIGQLFEK